MIDKNDNKDNLVIKITLMLAKMMIIIIVPLIIMKTPILTIPLLITLTISLG